MSRFLAVVLMFMLSLAAAAQPHLDQEQVNLETSSLTALGGSSEQKLAQVFTPARRGFVSHVTLPMTCQPTATVTVRIEETTGGVPNGVVLGAEDVPGTVFTSIPTPAIGFRLVELRHPVRVDAGVQYALTLEAVVESCGAWIAPAGDSYAGGNAYFDARPNAPGWIQLFDNNGELHDLAFQIFTVSRRGKGGR